MTNLARSAFQLLITGEDGVKRRFLVAAESKPIAEYLLCRHLGVSAATRFHLERLARSSDIERFGLQPDAVRQLGA